LNLDAVAAQICQQCGFEFRGSLGKGAFKSAYLAVYDGAPFALKLATLTGGTDRLVREAAALRDCDHPSIAKLLQAFPHSHDGHQLWVVYEEYLGGGTLEAGLKRWSITPESVRSVGVGLAEALEHLHDKRLVHRDIKPANIMFRGGTDKRPVLTDFGIVRMLDQPTLTHAFMQMGPGTPAYAAPEQLNNEKSLIDWRTDQFGLGLVLAECLLGHHPWATTGKSIQDAILTVSSRQELPPVSAQRLRDLGFASLTQALKVWPVARYRRPTDFLDALKRN
jgi:serine/threonine protein kinase